MTLIALLCFQRKCNTNLIFMSLLFLSLATARRIPYAAVFPGFGGNKGAHKEEKKRVQDSDSSLPPPPPPPETKSSSLTHGTSQSAGSEPTVIQRKEEFNGEEYSPQSQYWEAGPFNPYANLPPPPPGWIGPPPQWDHQSGIVQQELDNSVARENFLLNELQNLTSTLSAFQHRESLHLQQLDVLTERVMDAESDAATERNSLVEFRANCTKLEGTVAAMTKEMSVLNQKCQNLTVQHLEDQERYEKIKIKLKERSREVEELATVIEMARIEHDREQYLAERRKKKKQRGFFSWMFGFGEEDESEEERLQEFARTTLLRALQTERESVHELETSLVNLEQNNSAISEMVESRDMLIDELNNRVAVFEEDKIVLKAALRQLQKEIKEEAPKTQKLVDDLKDARQEVQSLNKMIDSILSDHQTEVSLLQNVITQKQKAINDTESNMTVIGTYVDKLEERLATFAIAKRDIELREKRCLEIEERVSQKEEENARLLTSIEELKKDQEELKHLLKDLVDERTQLQTEKTEIKSERDKILAEGVNLKDMILSLETDVDGLNEVVSERNLRVDELESTVKRQTSELQASADRELNLRQALAEKIDEVAKMQNAPSRIESEVSSESKRQLETEMQADGEDGIESEMPNQNEEEQPQSTRDRNATSGGHTMELAQPSSEFSATMEEQQQRLTPSQSRVESELSSPKSSEQTTTKEFHYVFPKNERQLEGTETPEAIELLDDTAATTQTKKKQRNVPFRKIRKTFSKLTGVHGAFTPPSQG